MKPRAMQRSCRWQPHYRGHAQSRLPTSSYTPLAGQAPLVKTVADQSYRALVSGKAQLTVVIQILVLRYLSNCRQGSVTSHRFPRLLRRPSVFPSPTPAEGLPKPP